MQIEHDHRRDLAEHDSVHGYRGRDPLRKSEKEARTVDWVWLRDGESQTLLQKVGFTIISLLFFGFGLFTLAAAKAFWDSGGWFFCFFLGAIAAFTLFFAILGLRNVLRFPKSEQQS